MPPSRGDFRRIEQFVYESIATDDQLEQYCEQLKDQEVIGIDTEFVSEDCYRPDLCLVQIVTPDGFAVIDPKPLTKMRLFWETLVHVEVPVIMHAGREELRFCLFETGRVPQKLFDVQIAAGFAGLEYPAAYSTLCQKLIGTQIPKHETRTNWRVRPLAKNQVEYALLDVAYLLPIYELLLNRIRELKREDWLQEEIDDFTKQVYRSDAVDPWRRVSGSAILRPKAMAIVRELWHWREEVAEARNCPARRVLRDDLIVELAKVGNPQEGRIRSIRGMERDDLKRHLPAISKCIAKILAEPPETWPRPRNDKENTPQYSLLIQFLHAAMGCICRDEKVAPSIACTSQDLREYVAWKLGHLDRNAVSELTLAQGWRSEMFSSHLDNIIAGNIALRVTDPNSEQPLSLVKPSN